MMKFWICYQLLYNSMLALFILMRKINSKQFNSFKNALLLM